MKVLYLFLVLAVPLQALSECRRITPGDYGEEKPGTATLFGGCNYLTPLARVGWSSEHSGFVGLGGLIPLDQSLGWAGGVAEKGISLMGTHYPDGNIYDIGYTQRRGWRFQAAGWDAGFSYRDKAGGMRGAYLGFNSFGSILIRYLHGTHDSEFSVEIGLKY